MQPGPRVLLAATAIAAAAVSTFAPALAAVRASGPASARPAGGHAPRRSPSPSPSATSSPSPTATTSPTASPSATVSASPTTSPAGSATSLASGPLTFAPGELNSAAVGASGCGQNTAGEPSIHVSRAGLVGLGSENGLGGGSAYWTGLATANPCGLTYQGQPNAVGGLGAAGGDIDTAFAPVTDPATGNYRIYVASLNLGSVNVATSADNGKTFSQVPVQAGIPLDDREWIAAYGAATSLLTYHDIATNNIDVLRSDSGGGPYVQIGTAISPTNYMAANNELGNIVIDHNNPAPGGSFYAYQSFVAPSADPGLAGLVFSTPYNEAFLAVSADGGHTFTDQPIPCSLDSSKQGLNHQFPNVSVAPNGDLVETWSNDTSVYAATSNDHGVSWSCTGPISSNTRQAIEPWVVTTNQGTDLVYYGSPDKAGPTQRWYVYVSQAPAGSSSFGTPQQVVEVHQGTVCEGGASCTTGRQLFDDFGIDTDPSGLAHIAYSQDAPTLGSAGTSTGYAVQTGGTVIGPPN